MKVRVSYALDLEEIPAEIERKFGDCKRLLSSLARYAETINLEDPEKFVVEVDKLRERMLRIDSCVAECHNIISGYVQATISTPEISDEASKEEEEE